MQIMKTSLAVGLFALGAAGSAVAQGLYEWETLDKRVTSAQKVQALGAEAFGDSISLQNGALSFAVTDIDVPGNSGLPVRFTRTYSVQNSLEFTQAYMLGDWSVQIPRVTMRYPEVLPNNRCSTLHAPPVPAEHQDHFELENYWRGIQIDLPGAGGELLVAQPGITKPADGLTYPWTTSNGQAHVRCLDSIDNGTGQGFLAVMPDGTRYKFGWMARHAAQPSKEKYSDTGGAAGTDTMPVLEYSLYVTEVSDRYDNKVFYKYQGGPNDPVKLTAIEGSDGRRIGIDYTDGLISAVHAGSTANPNQKTWDYDYGHDDHPGNPRRILETVTLPDASQWVLDFSALTYAPIKYDPFSEDTRNCYSAAIPSTHALRPYGTVTHPAGARAKFTMALELHGKTNVTLSCQGVQSVTGSSSVNDPSDDTPNNVIEYYGWSLVEKEVTGAGFVPQLWKYSYISPSSFREPVGAHANYISWPACTTANPTCYENLSVPQCTDDTCAGVSYTNVDAPDGSRERFVFGNSWLYNDGKLLRVERLAVAPGGQESELESVVDTFDLTRQDRAGAYKAVFGKSTRIQLDGFDAEYHRPRLSTKTSRDGATFEWKVNTDCANGLCMDSLARPLSVMRKGSLGDGKTYTKHETYTFDASLLPIWVLQPKTTSVNGKQVASATYSASTGAMQTFSAHNQLQQQITYEPSDGSVRTVTDGRNKTTTFEWKRGVPTKVTYHNATAESAEVNDLGWIQWTKDELGHQTTYGHDAMGRINSITHPSNDTVAGVAWAPTTIVFESVGAAEYGIGPTGLGTTGKHWRRTETTGSLVRQTFYDGLWRPVLERSYVIGQSPVVTRAVRRAFDHRGATTFESYPKNALANLSDDYLSQLVLGVTSQYDDLGRVTHVYADSELGYQLETETEYLPGFKTRVTNPRQYSTTTSYQAYDQPTTDWPMVIASPENVTTTFTRDVFGKPTTITRSGPWAGASCNGTANTLCLTRSYKYDDFERLCKTVEPDAGVTIMDYDSAGNLWWRATGQNNLASTSQCDRASVTRKSIYTLHDRGWVTNVDHPNGTADESYTYFDDGALHTATAGGGTWTYTYNKRRLLETESLAVDDKTFGLAWGYNASGHTSELTYPSGMVVGYSPNAYGEPTTAGTFATGAHYSPNGGLKGFTYGNLIVRTVEPNTRLLPSSIIDRKGSAAAVLSHGLEYDENGNVERITDGTAGGLESRFLTYDGLDRLRSATQTPVAVGDESFTYDPLDNIRSSVTAGVDRRFVYHPVSNRLDRVTNPAGTAQLVYGWNSRGEVSFKADYTTLPGKEQRFLFDDAGRMVQATGTECYRYDAHGHRTSTQRCGTAGTRYQVYSKAGQLLHVDDGIVGKRTDYIPLGNLLVARRETPLSGGATTTYLHSDHRGSPSVETDASGAVALRERRTAYGVSLGGVLRDEPGFTGHVTDAATGLSYMEQRYYDPAIGRFLSVDPVGPLEDPLKHFGRYHYVSNNPYKYIDPDGRSEEAWAQLGETIGVEISKYQYRNSTDPQQRIRLGNHLALVHSIKYGDQRTAQQYRLEVQQLQGSPAGVIYRRIDPKTGETYIGQAKSPERFTARQAEHDRELGVRHDYEVLGRAEPGRALDVAEETQIRLHGGLKQEGGGVVNRRHQMSEGRYRGAGGQQPPTGTRIRRR